MKTRINILFLFVCAFSWVGSASAQATGPSASANPLDIGITANLARGEITALSVADQKMSVRTKDGDIEVLLSAATVYKRMPLGEYELKKTVPTTLAEIGVGDRVVAVGKVSDDRKSVPARQVIVMSKADVVKKQEHDREEWTRRGITGRVTSVDPSTNQIVLAARTREGDKPITIVNASKAEFLRYAPDSVKFSDARPSTLAEVKVGDQLRALGNKSEDGATYTPEEVVFGSFAMVAGTITAVDAAKGEITIKNLQNSQVVTIVTNHDSLLRRFPAEMAMMMSRPGAGAAGGGSAPASGGPPASGGGAGGAGGPRRMGGDVDAMLERLPAVTLAELKKGDLIAVSSSKGADPNRVTAIKLLAGIEPFLAAAAGPARAGGAAQAPSMNLPGLDSIGLP